MAKKREREKERMKENEQKRKEEGMEGGREDQVRKQATVTCHIISGKNFNIHTTEDFKEDTIQEATEW